MLSKGRFSVSLSVISNGSVPPTTFEASTDPSPNVKQLTFSVMKLNCSGAGVLTNADAVCSHSFEEVMVMVYWPVHKSVNVTSEPLQGDEQVLVSGEIL